MKTEVNQGPKIITHAGPCTSSGKKNNAMRLSHKRLLKRREQGK